MNKEKINILFVLPTFDTGGSEKLVFDIIKNIDKSMFNPILCVFFSGKYEDSYLKLGHPFYVINKDKIISKISVVKFLNQIIRQHKIQVVNSHHTLPLIQGLLSFKLFNKVRWIHTEHTRLDLDPHVTPKILIIVKFCLRFVDYALGISQGVCDYFEKEMGLPRRKIVKILNGVDVEIFRRAKSKELRIKMRAELGIAQDEIVIGLFANFRKQKNHECLIKAAQLLKDKLNHFRVVFAGNGPALKESKELVNILGLNDKFIFLEPRLDIPQLMNMIDIYCLPSHFEGLPFSLLEAMAAEKIVVASDVIGNNEIAINLQNAILVKPNSPDDLRDKIVLLINDRGLGERLTANAAKNVEAFSFNLMIKKYEDLFSERGV
ncbi:MAG: glycosyltransferase [Candidatus Omnitrophica bacterium]|nr:glycosyltransferase [Candidatus Omnitrophota bacterium]